MDLGEDQNEQDQELQEMAIGACMNYFLLFISLFLCFYLFHSFFLPLRGAGGLIVEVSASQPRDRAFEPHTGHVYVSSYDTSTGWFKEEDSRVI